MSLSIRNLPLNALRVFSTVYQTGGVRSAARELRISHSSISRHLRACEDATGVALVSRQNGVLKFTKAGELLGQKSVECLSHLAAVTDDIGTASASSEVRISAPLLFAQRWLLPRIASIQGQVTGAHLTIIPEHPPFEPRVYDVRIGLGRSQTMDGAVPFMDENIVPVASPTYIAQFGTDFLLQGAVLLHSHDPDASWEMWQKTFGRPELDVSVGCQYANLELAMEAAAVDLGVALVRKRLAEQELALGRLQSLGAEFEFELKGAYWINTSRKSATSVEVQQVLHWIKNEAQNADGPSSDIVKLLGGARFGTTD